MRRREIRGNARFITFSCYRRLPLLHDPEVADDFTGSMVRARELHGFHLLAWVVMPEHVHLLVRPQAVALDRSLLWMKLSVSKRVISRWTREQPRRLDPIRRECGTPRF